MRSPNIPPSTMAILKIHDLLPIPQGTKQPHAYQIFGLEVGEQDTAKISAAVKKTINRLKETKETVDPKIWNQAAKLVQQAKQILADPDKKAQLDARFGIVAVATTTTAPGNSDPLGAVLPTADPLASVLPPADPLSPVAATSKPAAVAAPPLPAGNVSAGSETPPPMPPGMFGTPKAAAPPASPEQPVTSVVVKKPSRNIRRRRKSTLGTLVFATFAIGMLALIGGLGFMLVKYGQISLVQSNEGVAISLGETETENLVKINEQTTTSEDTPNTPPKPHDPVMGNLADNVPPPPPTQDSDSPPPADPPTKTPSNNPPPVTPTPPTETEAMMPVQPATTTPTSEMTEEMVAAGEERIQQVEQLLRTAKWKEMKPAAEKLTESMLTDEQRERAQSLYELADLASFYRGGIERGVASLKVGNDFQVTDSFRVIIVETGDDLLVVRYSAKNRSYKFDEFPFSLAHKLATFAMPADATSSLAAKAAYQALAPKATQDHRQEAIDWLLSIDEEIEGADPKQVAETIKTLFAEDS